MITGSDLQPHGEVAIPYISATNFDFDVIRGGLHLLLIRCGAIQLHTALCFISLSSLVLIIVKDHTRTTI